MDLTSVQKAIVESQYGPVAKEEGARLAEAFINALDRYPDTQWKTVAVECPWYMRLDEEAILVGVQDRLTLSPEGVLFGCEWKTRRGGKLKKDGTPYKGDTEEDWLDEIMSGPQLRIYALAMKHAQYIGMKRPVEFVDDPHILVRAAVKSHPVTIWPTTPEKGMFSFPPEYLWATQHALWSAVEQIRAARLRKSIPWALPSLHCENKYRRMCDYHEQFCKKGCHPEPKACTTKNSTDPGWAAIEESGVDLDNPRTVVLSASSFQNWLTCPEQYRILISGCAPGEESLALETGSVFHLAVAESFRQLERERA